MEKPKQIITPLKRLLNRSSIDELLTFLHAMQVQYVLKRTAKGKFEMSIFRDGMLRYQGFGGKSAKVVIVEAIAQFVTHEQKDFHEYKDEQPKRERDWVIG